MLPYCHSLRNQEPVSHLGLISGGSNKASTGTVQSGPAVPFQKKTVDKVINHDLDPSPFDECFLFPFEWGQEKRM